MQTPALTFHALPALDTNYIWVITADGTTHTAVVDPGEAAPVIHYFEHGAGRGKTLDLVLITHHHQDHIGGLTALTDRYAPRVVGPDSIAGVTQGVKESDTFDLFGTPVQVMATPGHTLDHLVYFIDGDSPHLLAGDTVFMAGCGRLFEGTADQMQANFARLRQLPDHTAIYGAHEYTQSNLAFAHAVEPDNTDIVQAMQNARRLAEAGRPTLPTSLHVERRINPFMRVDQDAVVQTLKTHYPTADLSTPASVFKVLRDWKDHFQS